MPARVTLATTQLAEAIDARSSLIKLVSTAGVLPGLFLWFDGELVRVVSLEVSPGVKVQRGVGSTQALPHASAVTVYIGSGDQFYLTDPVGRPPVTFEVSPWINLRNGTVWFAQGDTDPVDSADRWWQQQLTTYDQGPLGVRVKTPNPIAST